MRKHATILAAVGLLAARFVLLAIGWSSLHPDFERAGLANDARRFHEIAQADGTPYRDFPVEFPPVMLGSIELLDGDRGIDLARRLVISMILCDILIGLVLLWSWGRQTALTYWVLGTPLAFFLYFRLDLLSVLLAVAGVAFARRGKELASGASMAASVFAKVWPIALVPILAVERRARSFWSTMLLLLAGSAAWIAWAGIAGPRQVLTFRGATGWEVESLGGVFLWRVFGMKTRFESGAYRVGTVSPWCAVLLIGATVASVAWGYWRVRDDPARSEGEGATLAVSSLLMFSTLFSPQYLAWLLPWVAIGRDPRARIWMLIASVAASTVILYSGVPLGGSGGQIQVAALFVRDAAVVVIFASTVARLRRVSASGSDQPRTRAEMSVKR